MKIKKFNESETAVAFAKSFKQAWTDLINETRDIHGVCLLVRPPKISDGICVPETVLIKHESGKIVMTFDCTKKNKWDKADEYYLLDLVLAAKNAGVRLQDIQVFQVQYGQEIIPLDSAYFEHFLASGENAIFCSCKTQKADASDAEAFFA